LSNNLALLKSDFKAEAHHLGFSLFGITTLDPPPHLDSFEKWLAAGNHAGMKYLENDNQRQLRHNPRDILSGARSMILLGMPYIPPIITTLNTSIRPNPPSSAGLGQVAAYAWGYDYHEIIPPRIADLALFISKRIGLSFNWRGYTDTGPILERDHAQQAGLGWAGKNTCLIAPGYGSFFLLAEMILDLELEPDPPFLADRCGTCTRCIQACPTGCIQPDRTIQSGHCISYLTIENKGAIPVDLRSQIGGWVFGCDICQQVCPWNRFAPDAGDTAFLPRKGIYQPSLEEALLLDTSGFQIKYRRSPILRARRRGYLRNVAVALGNQHDSEKVPVLKACIENETEPLVRGHAAWAIGQSGGILARKSLETAYLRETDPNVITEIKLALESL
jgi:epoxyqueuosine reductase